MIKVATDCDKCVHKEVCSYRNNVKYDADKLKNTKYGNGPNDDYGWAMMSDANHVTITFSCDHYKEAKTEVLYR